VIVDGWEAMNVSITVGAWLNKNFEKLSLSSPIHFVGMELDNPPLTLQIGCKNCTKFSPGSTSPIDNLNPQNKPFLVINMAEKIQVHIELYVNVNRVLCPSKPMASIKSTAVFFF